jgi:hypothetical protein
MNLPRFSQLSMASKLSFVAGFVLVIGMFVVVASINQEQETRSRASVGPTITSISLINASNKSTIKTLSNGDVIVLSSLPTTCLNIRASTNPNPTGSVKFGFDGNANYHTESSSPYDIGGDVDNGNTPNCWSLKAGSHTVIATGYTGSNASGTAGSATSVSFTVVAQAPSPTVSPTTQVSSPTPSPTTFPSVTPTQEPTATVIPSPTATTAPTATTIPTATLAPGTSALAFDILLHGVGKSGDNVNPNAGGTLDPKHPTRTITVEVFDSQNASVGQASGSIVFDPATGHFSGTVPFEQLSAGVYTVKVKTPQYLRGLVPGIQTITAGQVNTLPAVSLIAGDVNGDNVVNILDYNILMGCYSDLLPPVSCNGGDEVLADLNDDGSVNQFDYNLFLRELTNTAGQ